jgi:hypothetical protein
VSRDDDAACELILSEADLIDFAGGAVTIALPGVPGSMRLRVRDLGSEIGAIGFDGSRVSFSGTPIGIARPGDEPEGLSLRIDLDAHATAAAVEALLENLVIEGPPLDAATHWTVVVCVLDARGRRTRRSFALRPADSMQPRSTAPAVGAANGARIRAAAGPFIHPEAESDGFLFPAPAGP